MLGQAPNETIVSQPRKVPKKGYRKLLIVAIVVALVVGGYLLHAHFKRRAERLASKPATAAQVEKVYKKSEDQALGIGDTDSYQIIKSNLAHQYLLNNDPSNAERVLSEVFEKVPDSKITSSTYYTMVDTEKAKGNQTQYKHYLQLLIAKLKAEGDSQSADAMQKVLDGTK